jgi:hypothetical protein
MESGGGGGGQIGERDKWGGGNGGNTGWKM